MDQSAFCQMYQKYLKDVCSGKYQTIISKEVSKRVFSKENVKNYKEIFKK